MSRAARRMSGNTVQRCSYQNLLVESSSHLEDSGRSYGIHGCFQLFALLVMANGQFLFGHKENIVAYQVNRKTGTPLVRAGGREKLILRGAGTPSSHDSDNTPVCLALEFTGFLPQHYSLLLSFYKQGNLDPKRLRHLFPKPHVQQWWC